MIVLFEVQHLKKSILKMMDRLAPKRIVVVSSAPQIRYPDCYGIDMANLEGLVAFRAALALLKDTNKYDIIEDIYTRCKAQEHLEDREVQNFVKEIYAPFTPEQVSDKIAELLSEDGINAEVKIIFQSYRKLTSSMSEKFRRLVFHRKLPNAGGNRVVNQGVYKLL